jgi:hypothetical protein
MRRKAKAWTLLKLSIKGKVFELLNLTLCPKKF